MLYLFNLPFFAYMVSWILAHMFPATMLRHHLDVGGTRRMSAGKGSTGAAGRPETGLGLSKTSAGHSDGALAALSRQLVQAKMAEADAQRKHRCTTSNVDLLAQKIGICIWFHQL